MIPDKETSLISLGYLPLKIVILRYSNGHIYRHDFYNNHAAEDFIKTFTDLNKYLMFKIGIEIFNSFRALTEEYKKEKPINYW